MKQRSPLRTILSVQIRCGGDMCSPDATNGVIDVRHLAAEVVQRLHRVAGDLVLAPTGPGASIARCVTESPIAHDSSMIAISSGDLMSLTRCINASPSVGCDVGQMGPHRLDERVVGLVHADPTVAHADLGEQRGEDRLHEPVHELACSMIGIACAAVSHDMPVDALSISPPEHSRIGSLPVVIRTPFSDVIFPAMSWARRDVR